MRDSLRWDLERRERELGDARSRMESAVKQRAQARSDLSHAESVVSEAEWALQYARDQLAKVIATIEAERK